MNFKTIPFILLIVFIIFSEITCTADADLETSLVLLQIQSEDEIIGEDPFFEILDMGDYILIPVNMISVYLDLDSTFNREHNMLILITGKEKIQIDLSKKQYIDHPEWDKYPPVIFDGEFFVTELLIEYLADKEIEWDSKYQMLIISGSKFNKINSSQPETEEEMTEEKKPANIKPDVIGPEFSLGSVQYRVILDTRKDESSDSLSRTTLQESAYLHGRAGKWAISLGEEGNLDLLDQNKDISLSLVRAQYKEGKNLIILGDAQTDLSRTLGEKDIRGIYYQYNNNFFNALVSYTSVSGEAEPGDTITLYLNGKLYRKKINIKNKTYSFEHVVLSPKKLNTIKIEIKKVNGEVLSSSKKIIASPRIFDTGTRTFTAVAGLYNERNNEDWNEKVVAASYKQAVNNRFSVSLEAALKELNINQDTGRVLGSDLGIAFRLSNNTVATIDWLIGGRQDKIDAGAGASFLYGLEKGYIEAIYLLVPEETARGINLTAGEKKQVTGSFKINEKSFINSMIRDVKYLDPDKHLTEGAATLTYRKAKGQFAVTGKISRETTFYKDEEKQYQEIVDEKGITLLARTQNKDFNGKAKLDLSFGNMARSDIKESAPIRGINIEGEVTKVFLKSFINNSELTANVNWFNDVLYQGNLEAKSEIEWRINEYSSLNLGGQITGSLNITTDKFQTEEKTIYTSAASYLNENIEISLNGSVNERLYSDTYVYYTAGLGVNYFINRGRVSANTGFTSPFGRREIPQLDGSLIFEKDFTSGLGVKIELARVYDNLWDEEAEYYVRLTFDQIIGFAQGVIQGQRFGEGEHNSFIGGLVYLDQNGNGKYDKGEKPLEGIKMALNGRRVATNKKGIFRFDFVRPDIYKLGFALSSLPADYTIVTEEQLVKIRENENLFLEYGLTMNGTISGKVFIDKDSDGQKDIAENPVEWVGFILDDNKKVYTRQDGSFYLENIPLGEHKLVLLKDTLPLDLKPVVNGEFILNITEKELDIDSITIPLVYKFISNY